MHCQETKLFPFWMNSGSFCFKKISFLCQKQKPITNRQKLELWTFSCNRSCFNLNAQIFGFLDEFQDDVLEAVPEKTFYENLYVSFSRQSTQVKTPLIHLLYGIWVFSSKLILFPTWKSDSVRILLLKHTLLTE